MGSMKRKDIKPEMQRYLAELASQGHIDPSLLPEILNFVVELVDFRDDAIVKELVAQIEIWEGSMPEDDTLYTLGLRKCIDLVKGKEFSTLDKDYREPKKKD